MLSSQAFTALIPLLILLAALSPADQHDVVSGALVDRFHLTGDAASAVRQLFDHPGSSAVGVFSGFLLVFSGFSLTRRMQRMYQEAWRLPAPAGVGHAVHALLGLTTLLLGLSLLYLGRVLVESLPLSDVLALAVSTLLGLLLWTAIPWLLLDRRVAWRRLIPLGVLTSVGTNVYGIASTIYLPRLLETYSRRYGLFGVTLALVGWLLAITFIMVAAAAAAGEFDRAPDPWARRLRRALGVESTTAAARPPAASPVAPG